MALDLSCIKYTNRRLFVRPFYGWGWRGLDAVPPQETHNDVLFPFHIRVHLLISFRDDARGGVLDGGIGVVEETNHFCNNFWIVFRSRRHRSNFTNRVDGYGINLHNSYGQRISGYADIAETSEHIQHYHDNALKPRPPIPEFIDYELRAEIDKSLQDFTLSNSGHK